MPSIKDLRKRIVSTKNTQQTTKAMKMVSAAKLRRAQEAVSAQRPYAREIGNLIRMVSQMSMNADRSPLLGRDLAEGETRKILLVVFTSDRGLCGGFNANIIKATQRWWTAEATGSGAQLSFVGRRGFDFFKTKKVQLSTNFADLSGKVTFQKARKLADTLTEKFLSGEATEIKFIYNEFKNAVTQTVVIEDFLPVHAPVAPGVAPGVAMDTGSATETPVDYIIKPSLPSLLDALLDKHFAAQCFRVMLESQAGEHGARMSAMENATKNAGEMIRKLTLQYNKQRQAGITKELLEIISGAESQKTAS